MTFKRIFGAVAMLIIGEAIYLGTDIWKSWLEVNVGSSIKAEQRAAVVESWADRYEKRLIHLGETAFPQSAIRGYPAPLDSVSSWDGNGSTDDDWIDGLKRDKNLFTPQSLVTLDASTAIIPFVHWALQEKRRGFADPNAKPIVSGLAIMKLNDLGGVECVVAAEGDHIVFIPLADYKAAGLPMYGGR